MRIVKYGLWPASTEQLRSLNTQQKSQIFTRKTGDF